MKIYLETYHSFPRFQTEYLESRGIKAGEVFEIPSLDFFKSLILGLNGGAITLSQFRRTGEQNEPKEPNLICIDNPHIF